MRLYELLSQSTQQQLDALDKQQKQTQQQPPGANPDPSAEQEDDGQGKFDADKVDGSLKDIAQSVQDNDAQPEPPGGSAMQEPALDHMNVKPIDTALLSQIKNLPYTTRYKFGENDPMHPLKIAAMSLADLSNLSNMVRFKIQARSIQSRIGLDDDIDMQYYTDLMKLVNTVTKFKKTNTSAQLSGVRPAPAYQNIRQGS